MNNNIYVFALQGFTLPSKQQEPPLTLPKCSSLAAKREGREGYGEGCVVVFVGPGLTSPSQVADNTHTPAQVV